MIRRRRTARQARERWVSGPWARLARVANSQAALALLTPRADRVISLIELRPGRRYGDIGCGTAAYAHLLAARAGLDTAPVTFDLAPGPGPVDCVGWPEQLPLRDGALDAITCLYFIRRFDDDVVLTIARELRRVLAPGGAALVAEVAPVRSARLERFHRWLLGPGCANVDLRGWGRLAALFNESGFDSMELVDIGPCPFPPTPRVAVVLRRLP